MLTNSRIDERVSLKAFFLLCAAGLQALFLLCATALPAHAQMFTYDIDRPRAVQSLSFAYQALEFDWRGDDRPDVSFEFRGDAYGAVYTRPSLFASVLYGTQRADEVRRDLRLLDAAILTWGHLHLSREASAGSSRLLIPIAIHTHFRRVAPKGEEDSLVDAFNITVLGLGGGLAYHADLKENLSFEARAIPVIGLALRVFGDAAGSSFLLDTDAQLHWSGLAGRFGVTAGYAFRTQSWNVGSSSLFDNEQDDLFDYRGASHLFRIGLNW